MGAGHSGLTFVINVSYESPSAEKAAVIANKFAELYLQAFRARFERIQQEYARRKRAFDNLFKHLPIDPKGSFAYRWQCILNRLAATSAADITASIRNHIRVFKP